MEIRRATVDDLPWMRVLFQALLEDGAARFGPVAYPTYGEDEYDNFVRIIYRQLQDNPNFQAFIAVDGHPIGLLAGEILERAIGKPHIFASPHWLYIAPGHRGKGVARALIATGTAWLRERGITHVEVTSLAGDDQWQRRGFQPYLSKFVLSIDGIDAIGRMPAPTPKKEPKINATPRRRGRRPKANGIDPHPEP